MGDLEEAWKNKWGTGPIGDCKFMLQSSPAVENKILETIMFRSYLLFGVTYCPQVAFPKPPN